MEIKKVRTWGEPARTDEPGYAEGAFYYRRGPGFVLVMDRRDQQQAARLPRVRDWPRTPTAEP